MMRLLSAAANVNKPPTYNTFPTVRLFLVNTHLDSSRRPVRVTNLSAAHVLHIHMDYSRRPFFFLFFLIFTTRSEGSRPKTIYCPAAVSYVTLRVMCTQACIQRVRHPA